MSETFSRFLHDGSVPVSLARFRRKIKKRVKSLRRASELAAAYPTSLVRGHYRRQLFRDLETFCLFIGYPRSGGSLVGALLDAHPRVIVAQEVDVLRYVDARFTRTQLYDLILANSRAQANRGRRWTGYSYLVPNQWQGSFDELQVIGDKKAGGSTHRLRAKPILVDRLRESVGVPIKVVHVIRNPYDNISTIARRRRIELSKAVEAYFSLSRTATTVIDRLSADEVIHVRHEDVIADPRKSLRELCTFLGVATSDDYLQDCASIVFAAPHQSRHETHWAPQLIDRVAAQMLEYPHLQEYAF
jgi:hypothetical protein